MKIQENCANGKSQWINLSLKISLGGENKSTIMSQHLLDGLSQILIQSNWKYKKSEATFFLFFFLGFSCLWLFQWLQQSLQKGNSTVGIVSSHADNRGSRIISVEACLSYKLFTSDLLVLSSCWQKWDAATSQSFSLCGILAFRRLTALSRPRFEACWYINDA